MQFWMTGANTTPLLKLSILPRRRAAHRNIARRDRRGRRIADFRSSAGETMALRIACQGIKWNLHDTGKYAGLSPGHGTPLKRSRAFNGVRFRGLQSRCYCQERRSQIFSGQSVAREVLYVRDGFFGGSGWRGGRRKVYLIHPRTTTFIPAAQLMGHPVFEGWFPANIVVRSMETPHPYQALAEKRWQHRIRWCRLAGPAMTSA